MLKMNQVVTSASGGCVEVCVCVCVWRMAGLSSLTWPESHLLDSWAGWGRTSVVHWEIWAQQIKPAVTTRSKRSPGWRHVSPSVCIIIPYLGNKRVPTSVPCILVRRSPLKATKVAGSSDFATLASIAKSELPATLVAGSQYSSDLAILASVAKSKYNEPNRWQTDRLRTLGIEPRTIRPRGKPPSCETRVLQLWVREGTAGGTSDFII